MAEARRSILGAAVRHRCAAISRSCLYRLALRQAIASQYRLHDSGRMELAACDDCGQPYLLQETWQPLSEDGELACPRCGATVKSWSSARSYVAYWLRAGSALPTR
jgi:hypothetical protein